MAMLLGAFIVPIVSTFATAQEWHLLHDYEPLSYEETKTLILDRTLTFPGLGRSTFHEDGSFVFTDAQTDVTRFGVFELRKDGELCVDFQNQERRCGAFLRDEGVFLLLNGDRRRIPVLFGVQRRPSLR
ncbi:hypothetical protein [Shimia sp. SDUM112013]|uniref:hypothetical protein n=1 Tax=Shimia sp. SDUM112013 TaxID=3136160 RepID=UPI0032EF69DE